MSSNRNSALVGVVVSVLIIGAVASIGYYQFVVAPNMKSTTSMTSTTTQPTCTATSCVNVSIIRGAGSPPGPGYGPATITVVLGVNSTIIWTNDDTALHTVTASDNSFNSRDMADGAVYKHTFTVAGTYTYTCIYHSWMLGTVIVKSG